MRLFAQAASLAPGADPTQAEDYLTSGSDVPLSTIQAYLETDYCVHGDSPAVLRVGEFCPALAGLHAAYRVNCSTFITACNPHSQVRDDAVNANRQSALAHELERRSLIFINGIGKHPSNKWPGEASFLVLGLGLATAKTLGTRLEQNAIVWNGLNAVPRLILLR